MPPNDSSDYLLVSATDPSNTSSPALKSVSPRTLLSPAGPALTPGVLGPLPQGTWRPPSPADFWLCPFPLGRADPQTTLCSQALEFPAQTASRFSPSLRRPLGRVSPPEDAFCFRRSCSCDRWCAGAAWAGVSTCLTPHDAGEGAGFSHGPWPVPLCYPALGYTTSQLLKPGTLSQKPASGLDPSSCSKQTIVTNQSPRSLDATSRMPLVCLPSHHPSCLCLSCSPGWRNRLVAGFPAPTLAPLQFLLCTVATRIFHPLIL